jgi:hypothetical protein
MRSELVFGATKYVSNRYLLTKLAAQATRKLHKPNTRIEETMNDVFERFTRSNPIPEAPYTGSLQSFPSDMRSEADSFQEQLEESVA